jgi:hypothetical protein
MVQFREIKTQNILQDYKINTRKEIKIFCPNCLCLKTREAMRKHFGKCAFVLKGKERPYGELKVIDFSEDPSARIFVNRVNKFILSKQSQIQKVKYSKKKKFFVTARQDKKWGFIPQKIIIVRPVVPKVERVINLLETDNELEETKRFVEEWLDTEF